MARVIVKNSASLDAAIKKFKKKVDKEGIMYEIRRREYYVGPSLKRRLKHERALRQRKKFENG